MIKTFRSFYIEFNAHHFTDSSHQLLTVYIKSVTVSQTYCSHPLRCILYSFFSPTVVEQTRHESDYHWELYLGSHYQNKKKVQITGWFKFFEFYHGNTKFRHDVRPTCCPFLTHWSETCRAVACWKSACWSLAVSLRLLCAHGGLHKLLRVSLQILMFAKKHMNLKKKKRISLWVKFCGFGHLIVWK